MHAPQTPLAKARSFAARDILLRGIYIQISPKNFIVGAPPPLRNPAYVPEFIYKKATWLTRSVEHIKIAHLTCIIAHPLSNQGFLVYKRCSDGIDGR